MDDETNIMYKLGGIEALIRTTNDKLDRFIEETKENHKDHESRLAAVESKVAQGDTRRNIITAFVTFVISTVIAIAGILWPK